MSFFPLYRRGAGAFSSSESVEKANGEDSHLKETPPTTKKGEKYCFRETEKRLQRKRLGLGSGKLQEDTQNYLSFYCPCIIYTHVCLSTPLSLSAVQCVIVLYIEIVLEKKTF